MNTELLQDVPLVNIHGDPWQPSAESLQKKVAPKNEGPAEFHKGWRVEGLPPGSLADAAALFDTDVRKASKERRTPPEWDEGKYLSRLKLKAVLAKPYEVPEAAQTCKQLAERSGWLRVSVREVKKEAA